MKSNLNYFTHKSSYVDNNVLIGKGTKIWHFSHIQSGAIIGESCSVGQNVNIGNNVKIGNHVKIQNNVSVYEGVELEDYVFVVLRWFLQILNYQGLNSHNVELNFI
tara:strand:+ start:511 stop:828 length:318 start_codon:yes stop_codon:yes gene_type:complete